METKTALIMIMIHKYCIILMSDTLTYIQNTQDKCFKASESNRELVEHARSFNTEVLQAAQ